MVNVCTTEDFILAARRLKGVPFLHQGRNPNYGIDCVGLVVVAGRSVGLDVSNDRTNYPRAPYGILIPVLDVALCRVSVSTADTRDWKAGDILAMKMKNEPTHVAIWTGVSIIHTYATLGKVVEHALNPKWIKRIEAVYRFKEFS